MYLSSQRAGAAPLDPWARVPVLPSACYTSQDRFLDQVTAALESISNEIERRENANRAIREQHESQRLDDPFAEAARIQRLMAEDPDRALEVLQQVDRLGDQTGDGEQVRLLEEWQRLNFEIDRWLAGFEDNLSKSRAPLKARFDAVAADDGLHEPCGELYCLNQRGVEQHNRIVADWNSSYERLCADQWLARGGLIGQLERLRRFLATERLAFDLKTEADANESAAWVGEGSAKEFLEVAPWQAVHDYLNTVQRAFQHREGQPLAAQEYRKRK